MWEGIMKGLIFGLVIVSLATITIVGYDILTFINPTPKYVQLNQTYVNKKELFDVIVTDIKENKKGDVWLKVQMSVGKNTWVIHYYKEKDFFRNYSLKGYEIRYQEDNPFNNNSTEEPSKQNIEPEDGIIIFEHNDEYEELGPKTHRGLDRFEYTKRGC